MKPLATTRRRLLALIGLSPVAAVSADAASAGAPPAPAPGPLLLVKTRVNGELYYQAGASVETLATGDPVILRREPANPHDPRAIEVLDLDDRKLGYVARIDNPALARMMDAGERMRATVAAVDPDRLDVRLHVEWLRG